MRKENIFVFAVCGADSHIKTLNFSLAYLKKAGNHRIMVVTDLSRTAAPIAHNEVIDHRTPEHLDHHQASIYLKTNLHRILPKGPIYCYLDSDVVAVRPEVEKIFSHYTAPITFATDHCKLQAFSPNAVNCTCSEGHKEAEARAFEELLRQKKEIANRMAPKETALVTAIQNYEQTVLRLTPELRAKRDELVKLFGKAKATPLLYPFILLFRILPKFRRKPGSAIWRDRQGNVLIDGAHNSLEEHIRKTLGFQWEASTETWQDEEGNKVFVDPVSEMEASGQYKWDATQSIWRYSNGQPVFLPPCDHLREQIRKKFGTDITNPNWQHWNGGVFLFDAQSTSFLDTWHQKTMAIFEDPEWKTRDQGTLIATVWELGLQDHPTLPIAFNFLADYYHPTLKFNPQRGFQLPGYDLPIQPLFTHVYHHWGDKTWAVWRWIESLHPASPSRDASPGKEEVFCTVSSLSHLYKVAALFDSVREQEPAMPLAVLIVDAKPGFESGMFAHLEKVTVCFPADLKKVPLAESIFNKYHKKSQQDALRWSAKSLLMTFLLEHQGYERALYVDNDIYFFGPFRFLFKALESHPLILTPHRRPLDPFDHPDKFHLDFRDGQFNGGFIGAAQSGLEALKWWPRACLYKCERDDPNGLFVDQKYMDVLFTRTDNAKVIRHEGCNVAVWNLEESHRSVVEGEIRISEKWPVVFVHFTEHTFAAILEWKLDPVLEPLALAYEKHLQQYNPNFSLEKYRKPPSFLQKQGWKMKYYLNKVVAPTKEKES